MNSIAPRHAVIILAAGASRRLGTAKQLLCIEGESLVRRATRAAWATHPSQISIVVGKEAEAVFACVADLNVERVDCADWATGLSASLRAGIGHVNTKCDGALIVLCDQPELTAAHLNKLVSTWHRSPDYAVASGYAGTLGVPAILPRGWFDGIDTITGDQGARDLLRSRAASVIAISAVELQRDIDMPGDLPSTS